MSILDDYKMGSKLFGYSTRDIVYRPTATGAGASPTVSTSTATAMSDSLNGWVVVVMDGGGEPITVRTSVNVEAGDRVIATIVGTRITVTDVQGGGDKLKNDIDTATASAAAANQAAADLNTLALAQQVAINEAAALLAGQQLEASTALGLAITSYQAGVQTMQDSLAAEIDSETDARSLLIREVYETDANGDYVLDLDGNKIFLYTEIGRPGSDFAQRSDNTRTWYVFRGAEVSTYGALGLEAPKAWLKGDQTGTALTMGTAVQYDWVAKSNGNLSLKVRSTPL